MGPGALHRGRSHGQEKCCKVRTPGWSAENRFYFCSESRRYIHTLDNIQAIYGFPAFISRNSRHFSLYIVYRKAGAKNVHPDDHMVNHAWERLFVTKFMG